MSNSFSRSESFKFGLGLGVLLVLGVALQWWQQGISLLPTLWGLGALAFWGLWMRHLAQGSATLPKYRNGTRCGPGPVCAAHYPNTDQWSLPQPVLGHQRHA